MELIKLVRYKPRQHRIELEAELEAVKKLTSDGVDVNCIDFVNGKTALIYSMKYENVNIVKLLIDAGAYVDCTDYDGWTALMYSIGNIEITRVLIDAGADLNRQDCDEKTALMYAVKYANNDEEENEDNEYKDKYNTVKLLIDAGADLNYEDNIGYTALMWAVQWPNKDSKAMVKLLIDAGADIDAENYRRQTALRMSAANSNRFSKAIVKLLIDAGADTTGILEIAHKNNKEIIKKCLKQKLNKHL